MYTEQSFNSARADLIKCELLARALSRWVSTLPFICLFIFCFFSYQLSIVCLPTRSIFNNFIHILCTTRHATCATNRNANGRGCLKRERERDAKTGQCFPRACWIARIAMSAAQICEETEWERKRSSTRFFFFYKLSIRIVLLRNETKTGFRDRSFALRVVQFFRRTYKKKRPPLKQLTTHTRTHMCT